MRKRKPLVGILVAGLLGLALAGFVMAEAPSHPALTGKVSSQAEGPMEGVLVGAKKMGSTITTWVVSNAQGQYSFPGDRIEPGKYAIRIRAVGYELPSTSVDVAAQPTQLDLQLNKITSTNKLAMQLTNAEWRMSVPGNPGRESNPRVQYLPHASAHHVLSLQCRRDGNGVAADGHAHEQLFAHASLGASLGRAHATAPGKNDRAGQIPGLD